MVAFEAGDGVSAERRTVLAGLCALGAGCTRRSDDSAGNDPSEDADESSDGADESSDGASESSDGADESSADADADASTDVTRRTTEPDPTDEQFTNPYRGWVLSGWPGAYEDASELLSYGQVGYARLPWVQLQPGQETFDWAPLEAFLDGWDELGLQAAVGVMTANSHSPADRPFVTPEWVFDDGAAYQSVSFDPDDSVLMNSGTPGEKVVPKFDDPVFLEHLERFLEAFADRYDGDDRLVGVDVRSYGNWGEGHMWPFYQHFENVYEPLGPEGYRRHVDLHTAALEETQLFLNAKGEDHEHRDVQTGAVERAGVGLRADGVVGSSDGSEVEAAYPSAPAVFEWFQSYEWLRERGWWGGSPAEDRGYDLEDCVERGRPTYVGFNQFDSPTAKREFLGAEPELVERLSRRIGYRLELTEATVPTSVPACKCAELSTTWRNVGVAPLYEPGHVAVGLLDGDTLAERFWIDADPSEWLPDATTTVSAEITPSVDAGEYDFAVGVFTDRDLQSPDVRLAVDTERVDRWHVLGTVTVE